MVNTHVVLVTTGGGFSGPSVPSGSLSYLKWLTSVLLVSIPVIKIASQTVPWKRERVCVRNSGLWSTTARKSQSWELDSRSRDIYSQEQREMNARMHSALLLHSPGAQTREWCHPLSGWVFPQQARQSRQFLIETLPMQF